MSEYHEDIEYDLLVHAGVDLLDFYRGTLTARRLWLLIRRLPPTSEWFKRAFPDQAVHAQWGLDQHMMADLLDVLRNHWFKDPPSYPRAQERIDQAREPQQMSDFFAAQRERNRLREIEGD